MPKKKPLTIVSKSAARIAAVQIFYNAIISKKNISDVFQDYNISTLQRANTEGATNNDSANLTAD